MLKYNSNAKYSYHSSISENETEQYWALKNKIQDLIDNKTIEFNTPPTPNVIIAPMAKHDKGVNVVDDDLFIPSTYELATPLAIFKKNILRVSLFPGCGEGCHLCTSLPNGCLLLKIGVQHLMDNKEIMFEKTPSTRSLCEDILIITISDNPPRVSSKRPVRITSTPKVAPLIITFPGPIPYSYDKVVPWNYGVGVYYHGIKQDLLAIKK